jgi:predicted nucleic acid-binding protein
MVIVDTSTWIPFFNRPESREKQVIDELIDRGDVAVVGIVLAELLQGCRSQEERDELKEALLALPYLGVSQATWIAAGEISSNLLRKGITLPLTDVVLAAVAIEHRCSVYSLDTHFQKFPGLLRYTPAER